MDFLANPMDIQLISNFLHFNVNISPWLWEMDECPLYHSCEKAWTWGQNVLGFTLASSIIPNKFIFFICEVDLTIILPLIGQF